jgi:hypothetical protein
MLLMAKGTSKTAPAARVVGSGTGLTPMSASEAHEVAGQSRQSEKSCEPGRAPSQDWVSVQAAPAGLGTESRAKGESALVTGFIGSTWASGWFAPQRTRTNARAFARRLGAVFIFRSIAIQSSTNYIRRGHVRYTGKYRKEPRWIAGAGCP